MSTLSDKTFVVRDASGRPTPTTRGRAVPSRLGRYEIQHELGKGAMGVVYRARDPMINREVALKTIPLAAEFEGDELEQARVKFFREAEMAGRLSHPHIVTIYDAGEHEGTAYIAMELLRGVHLVEYTDSARLLPPAIASFAGDVIFSATSHSAAAMKSSKTFCFRSFVPARCHSVPYSPPPRRLAIA